MAKLKIRKVSSNETSRDNTEPAPEELSGTDLCNKIVELSLDLKSLDSVAFDVSEISSIANFIVIVSGTSTRHVKGICDKITDGTQKAGTKAIRVEGYESGDWIIIDYGDVMAHVFYEPKRQEYDFDALFQNASKITFDEELQNKVRSFKTGLHSI